MNILSKFNTLPRIAICFITAVFTAGAHGHEICRNGLLQMGNQSPVLTPNQVVQMPESGIWGGEIIHRLDYPVDDVNSTPVQPTNPQFAIQLEFQQIRSRSQARNKAYANPTDNLYFTFEPIKDAEGVLSEVTCQLNATIPTIGNMTEGVQTLLLIAQLNVAGVEPFNVHNRRLCRLLVKYKSNHMIVAEFVIKT